MKYLSFILIPMVGYVSLVSSDWKTISLIVLTFVIVPLLEWVISGSPRKLTKEEEKSLQSNNFYDWLLYTILPVQYFLLFTFLSVISHETSGAVILAKTITMGILCGVLGINVAHELGHRQKKVEQGMAKSLLLTSLYMHFYIEHNRGHHKAVGTPNDPATAKLNESVYQFIIRCIPAVFVSAWNLEKNRMTRISKKTWSLSNQMIQFLTIEIFMVLMIAMVFGFLTALYFVAAASIGFILLECIDYIEHYGLSRKEIRPGIFEQVQSKHSWNCNHLLGRILLFELPLHPVHHRNSSLPYQVLQSDDNAPQMPFGYPGMILLSLIPPIWFKRINPISIKAML